LASNPDVLAAEQAQELAPVERANGHLDRAFSQQAKDEVARVRVGMSQPVADQVQLAFDSEFASHPKEAARGITDSVAEMNNRRPVDLRKQIAQGRAVVASLGEAEPAPEGTGSGSRVSRWIGRACILLGIWNVSKTYAEKGLWEASKTGLQDIAILGGLHLMSQSGTYASGFFVGLGSGIGYGMLAWTLWELSALLEPYVAPLVMRADDEAMIGKRYWEVPYTSGRIERIPVGFLIFPKSPAAALDPDRWFLHYETEQALTADVIRHLNALTAHFGSSDKVPPFFADAENYNNYVRVVKEEWRKGWKKEMETLDADFDRWRVDKLSSVGPLIEPASGQPIPKPRAAILYSEMQPSIPTRNDQKVTFTTYFGVGALPGDSLDLKGISNLRKAGSADAGVPERVDPMKAEYKTFEAVHIFKAEQSFDLSGSGDYEYTFEARVAADGVNPPPKTIRFSISGAGPPSSCAGEAFNQWLQSAVPAFPLLTIVEAGKRAEVMAHPVAGRYGASGAYSGQLQLPVEGESKVDFSISWGVYPPILYLPQNRPPDRTEGCVKSGGSDPSEYRTNVLGPNSCMKSAATRGTMDPNASGDPYLGGASVMAVVGGCEASTQVTIGVYPPARHGARNKSEVIGAIKSTGETIALSLAALLTGSPAPRFEVGTPKTRSADLPADLESLASASARPRPSFSVKQAAGERFIKGFEFKASGRSAEARTEFQEAVRTDPGDVLNWMGLATTYLDGKDWLEAEAVLKLALRVDRLFGPFHGAAAEALLRLDRRQEAMAEGREAMRLGLQNLPVFQELGLSTGGTTAEPWPDLSGTWYCPGDRSRRCAIAQSGALLVFTNEFGGRSAGGFVDATSVVAADWMDGLRGKVSIDGRRIVWPNFPWTREPAGR
jgi:hypothetical protein